MLISHKQIKSLIAVVFISVLAGCANPYEKFYQPVQTNIVGQLIPPSGEPRVIQTSVEGINAQFQALMEDGYIMVGRSTFVGPAQDQGRAVNQAKKVGASLVVIAAKYQSTATGAIPITTTTPQTTYNNGTMTAYGNNGGMVNGSYSGTSTTYNTQTTMIPYSVDRYDQGAYYFSQHERIGIGLYLRDISAEERQRLGTNHAIFVTLLRKGSPAYAADILPGDFIVAMNGDPVLDSVGVVNKLRDIRGSKVSFTILRNGNQIAKDVFIPAGQW